jgi:dolichol kinase
VTVKSENVSVPQAERRAKTEDTHHLDFRFEFARKAIHLSSLIIVIIYCHISRELALLILSPIVAGFFLVDVLKNFVPFLSIWYHETFDSMLRKHELEKNHIHLNGATCITLSALFLIALFPKIIAITSFSMVAVSDTVAALAGRKFGKHRFGEKSIEGSLAFLISSIIIVSIIPNINIAIGLAMAVTATLAEAVVIRIRGFKLDDNITIPLVSAVVGILCYMLFLPSQIESLSSCP